MFGAIGQVGTWLIDKIDPRRLRNRKRSFELEPASGERLTILVARLEDDDKRDSHQSHILRSLERQFRSLGANRAVDVIEYGEPLSLPDIGSRHDAWLAAAELGRKWLREKNADILVWGAVTDAGKTISLRFLARETETDTASQAYRLTETTELPAEFSRALANILVGEIAAAGSTILARQGHFVANILEPLLVRLRALAKEPPPGFDSVSRGRILITLGVAARVYGEQLGVASILEEAVAAYQAALEYYNRDQRPTSWARAQNGLGNALRALGELESDTRRLSEAVLAYEAALEGFAREIAPLEWGLIQNNLGNALTLLGTREGGTALLEGAVTAFREALKERTRERLSSQWAMSQNNLGNALALLGTRENGTASLDEAIKAYELALEERTRERNPLQWAATCTNLGSALALLGTRENETARLEQAELAHRRALDVYTRAQMPLDWAKAQYNLGNTLEILGEREQRTDRLVEAIAAYQGALEVFQGAEADYYVEMVRRNLVRAEGLLAKRRRESGLG